MESERSGSQATRRLLASYYEALGKQGDWSGKLSDGFQLSGTVTNETRARDANVSNGFIKMAQGLHVRQLIAEGAKGFALARYDLTSPRGVRFTSDVAEFWTVKDGRLDSVSIYFDTAAFSKHLAQ